MSQVASVGSHPAGQPGAVPPLLYFVVFGDVDVSTTLPASKYRVQRMPEEVEILRYDSAQYPEVVDSFRRGHVWDDFQRRDSSFAAQIAKQEACMVVRAEFAAQDDLSHLRDVVGITTWMLDQGGVCVYDPQMLRWWSADEWWRKIFEPVKPVVRNHCVILVSPEEGGGEWVHTRGMRKFGRPDLSIRGVQPEWKNAAVEVCNRFIEFQVHGGPIEEGRAVVAPGLPEGFTCRHRGDLEDPDFNNAHVAIER